MKLLTQVTLSVMAKTEPTRSQDGKTLYYRLACLQNGQATNLSCTTDEVYNAVPDGFVEARFNALYDDEYGTLKIDSIDEIIYVNGVAYGAAPDVKPDVKPDTKTSGSSPDKK